MNKAVFTLFEKCVGCKGCEIACAVEHSRSKKLDIAQSESPRPRSRVRVETAGHYTFPSRCVHCEDAACIAACPMGAMTRSYETGAVYVDQDKCVGCWMCVTVCPFGGVGADPGTKKASKCDLCPDRSAQGLDPACVTACPTGAMVFATADEFANMRRKMVALANVGAIGEVPENVALWRSLRGGK